MIPLLFVENVRCSLGGREVLRGLTFTLREGERLAVVGPNGAGKTTLLRILAGTLSPSFGRVTLEGRELLALPPKDRARKIAVLPAETATPFAFTVREFVSIGRTPHLGWFGGEREEDDRAVARALEATGTAGLREREVTTLSSGERQRVFLAQALAQAPSLLLLDEPTAHLDLAHEIEIFDRLVGENRDGLTWIAVLHDLNLASEYAERILLLREGRILGDGPPEEVLREETLRAVFGEGLLVDRNPSTGAPNVRIAPRRRPVAQAPPGDYT